MTKNEKKFWDILTNLFVGAEVKGKSGFISLMRAKQNYFKKVEKELFSHIDNITKDNQDFKEELYDKLYSFFHRYFSESGSIYYNYTPLFYNIYTKAYENNKPNIETTYSTDYEQIISNKQDTSLFYKTQMLYYVKSDKIFKDLEIEIEKYKYIFDVSDMQGKSANEKKELVYILEKIEDKSFYFSVNYSIRGKKTKIADMLKVAKKQNISIKEEDLKKAFRVFERQVNIDYFINKDAKKFLTEQLDMWIYQYMFSQEADFDMERFEQIKNIKATALKLIDFISQFENELVKIWNKPRFVINSNIVVSMDKLQDKEFDIERIKTHRGYAEQQDEWKELGIIADDGLIENPHLPIDTKYFKDLQEEIEELFEEDEFDGLLIKSENYQALNTILPRYKGLVDLTYIDPPFNTGDDFAYIDKFQDSTWLSLMENRLELAKDLMSKKGSFYLHLDYRANFLGRHLMDNLFGKNNLLNEIIYGYRIQGIKRNAYANKHDTIYIYTKTNPDTNIHIFNVEKEKQIYQKPFIDVVTVKPNLLKVSDKDLKTLQKCLDSKMAFPDRYKDKLFNSYYAETFIRDIWDHDDTKPLISGAKEYSQFQTQKSEGLLKRVITNSSNMQSIIMDYHSGSGTTIATAQKLGRKWLGIEMGDHINTFYEDVVEIETKDIDSIEKFKIIDIIETRKTKSVVKVLKTGINGRMKEIIAGQGKHEPCGISKDVDYQGGGLFKYYELEQYEQILRKLKYTDVPDGWLKDLHSEDIKDCFLFDSKLSDALDTTTDNYKIDVSKLYENIDLKETIHNLTGKRPSEITDDRVTFKDGTSYPLMQILKPLLIW